MQEGLISTYSSMPKQKTLQLIVLNPTKQQAMLLKVSQKFHPCLQCAY
jgi:hypothetical protein